MDKPPHNIMLFAFQNEKANEDLCWDKKTYAEVSEYAAHWNAFPTAWPSVQNSASYYPVCNLSNYGLYTSSEQEIISIRNEIQRCNAVIAKFHHDWWYAENYGISSTGTPISTLCGPARLVAIWKYIGQGNMYAGIAYQNEFVGCRDKIPTLYRLLDVLSRYHPYVYRNY